MSRDVKYHQNCKHKYTHPNGLGNSELPCPFPKCTKLPDGINLLGVLYKVEQYWSGSMLNEPEYRWVEVKKTQKTMYDMAGLDLLMKQGTEQLVAGLVRMVHNQPGNPMPNPVSRAIQVPSYSEVLNEVNRMPYGNVYYHPTLDAQVSKFPTAMEYILHGEKVTQAEWINTVFP